MCGYGVLLITCIESCSDADLIILTLMNLTHRPFSRRVNSPESGVSPERICFDKRGD